METGPLHIVSCLWTQGHALPDSGTPAPKPKPVRLYVPKAALKQVGPKDRTPPSPPTLKSDGVDIGGHRVRTDEEPITGLRANNRASVDSNPFEALANLDEDGPSRVGHGDCTPSPMKVLEGELLALMANPGERTTRNDLEDNRATNGPHHTQLDTMAVEELKSSASTSRDKSKTTGEGSKTRKSPKHKSLFGNL